MVPPNYLKEQSEEIDSPSPSNRPARNRRPKPAISEADFDEAYRLYPRHVGKDAARKAYAAAIGRGVPPPEILSGVMRYAGERAGEPERFTAHMATWLNAGRWADSPGPSVAHGQSAPQRRPRDFSALGFAASRMEHDFDE